MSKKLIIFMSVVLALLSVSACFAADNTSEQLMQMLQQKMEEVASLKAENETLKAENEALKSELLKYQTGNNNAGGIVRQQTCTNQAEFIEDVTIPDGTKIGPGEAFRKTWRLRNTGTCTWTQGYKVVSVGKFNMGGQQYANIPQMVKPGEMVDISMDLRAPTYYGDYASEYRLQDENGEFFGIIGTVSKKELSFWLKITVEDKSKCALMSFTPGSVSRNGEFDAVFKIKNNSGETWHAKGVDVRMTNGKEFLKYDNPYIDLPQSVDPGNTITLTWDMVASDESGNHAVNIEFIKDGGVYCTVYGNVNFK